MHAFRGKKRQTPEGGNNLDLRRKDCGDSNVHSVHPLSVSIIYIYL